MKNYTSFKSLPIGQTFDFVSGASRDSFYAPCIKVSARKYAYYLYDIRVEAEIGSIKAEVYNVGKYASDFTA